ncbi:MAG: hypothetical protein PHT88_04880 [Candidatus Moranbacteria bacterium]|nr:hypothetical protein [Candidatus Moranbacteria bacterium]
MKNTLKILCAAHRRSPGSRDIERIVGALIDAGFIDKLAAAVVRRQVQDDLK